jgi:hypothetical protein
VSASAQLGALVARRYGGRLACWALLAGAVLIGLPVLLAVVVMALFAGSPQVQCAVATTADAAAGLSGREADLFNAPLDLQPGRSYPAGATYYEAGDSTGSGTLGAIPDPTQANLRAHPDSFAELTLATDRAAKTTFDTADALGALPWMTGLRVTHGDKSVVVYKRDIGYGQGPKTIQGERYRLDLWGPAARQLGITSGLVHVALAPTPGAGNTLGDASPLTDEAGASAGCRAVSGFGGPLPLTAGDRARLLPDGLAAAPQTAPAAVKAMIAAGNEIAGRPYLYGAGHGLPLGQIAAAYDCSSSAGHLLYAAALLDSDLAPTSGQLVGYGQPGYGPWVSVLANSDHVYLYVAGLRWDTHRWGSGDQGVSGIGWHTAPRPDSGFTPRHPEGL